jgi:hypothetical protein
MLKIRKEQLEAFEYRALQNFEDEMIAHGKVFAPIISQVIGDAQLRIAVRQTIATAGKYGFTLRGPIRLCVELMFLCGSGFDTDPQYPGIGEVLRSSDGEMRKAERIHLGHAEYLEHVAGPDNINVRKALEAVAAYARNAPDNLERNLENEVLEQMVRAFPQRVTFIGETALRALVAEGRAVSARYGFATARSQALIIILMSAFGHGCTNDPLYPWIHQTLVDPQIVDATGRAQRLERKALTWLDHVLARPATGAPG